MSNFTIYFEYPWLLLLFVAAFALTLIPHFRLAKRYRRTRNRILSIVCHLTVMTLAILTLAGIEFRYQVPNDENEIIFLVDVSDTEEESQAARDRFLEVALEDGQFDNFKIGVVTFGYDQEYAVPMTYNVNEIYDAYLNAERPDTTATNIASALKYTKDLFDNPQTAKIVLITDGKETDETANTVIRSISAQGTKVDVAYVDSKYTGSDMQVLGVTMPDRAVSVGSECEIIVNVQSQSKAPVTVELTDKGEAKTVNNTQDFEVNQGLQALRFKHTFEWDGLHELQFKITTQNDALKENNVYSTYLYLKVYNNLLVLERVSGESTAFTTMLNDGATVPYHITVKCVKDDGLPKTIDELRLYDQVILNNIANKDMPEGFDVLLEEYVSEYGGGLFTIGGNDEQGEANAYNREDMRNTLYQQMLPVQAIDYTPPVGVMLIIDRSGSMTATDDYGDTKLQSAKASAVASLEALSERDYIGVMTLDDAESEILELTPRSKEAQIVAAINGIEDASGGTVFPNAIQRAGQKLRAEKNVQKRHIILITDGIVSEEQRPDYEGYVDSFYKTDGITLSVIAIGMDTSSEYYEQMKYATELGHGEFYAVKDTSRLTMLIREDLNAPRITEVVEETFSPIVNGSAAASPLLNGVSRGEGENINKLTVSLDGFYGVKARSAAEIILKGDYEVPIYAQWKYGKGMVGSFMCDLNGGWSSTFMADENGKTFIRNVVNNLSPIESIRPKRINFDLREDNYTNKLSVYTDLKEGEYVKGELIGYKNGEAFSLSLNEITQGSTAELREKDCYVTAPLEAANNYSRCNFVVRGQGTYRIVLKKYDASGNVIKVDTEEVKVEAYKAFAYSEEYDTVNIGTDEERQEALKKLAERGDGVLIEDLENPWEIFDDFVTEINKSFDPRYLFMIMAIVIFLADIAIRKFKFKWPHELIRAYKEKKEKK